MNIDKLQRRIEKHAVYEEYAYVLDFIKEGRSGYWAEATTQLVGESYFTLLEAAVKQGVTLTIGERVYVGKESREKISYIKGRLTYDELTPAAKAQLPNIIMKIIEKNEQSFTEFFNKSSAINQRLHSLELIPGIGKKYLQKLLEEREKAPFKNFEDIKKRVNIRLSIEKSLAERILEEITTDVKYRLFTRKSPPIRK